MFAAVAFLLAIGHVLSAIDLNIYKSVTEIRQIQNGVGNYQYLFQNGEYSNIIDGSITWDGTPFTRQELYNTIDTLKDAKVVVRQSSVCDCRTIDAKIIDPNTMLLENLETGAFFYADSRSIEYTTKKPSNAGTTLIFEFSNKKSKFNGTLSYLMRGISWTPNYDLFIVDDDSKFIVYTCYNRTNDNCSCLLACSLSAYATIRNNQQRDYDVNNTFLYSGDLQLVNNYGPVYNQPGPVRAAMKSSVAESKSISFDGEERGFYFYSLKNNYKLRPASSIRLPFVEIDAKCRFYYKTTTNIGTGQYKGVFQRNYDLTLNKFAPAGIATLRDNKVLVGQSNLPDIPQNYTHTITLGQDSDVRYTIKGNLTATSDDKNRIIWRTYELDINIANFKNKHIRGQLDFYGATQTTIEQTTCQSATVDSTLLKLPFDLNDGENLQCQLTVTLRWS
jgi:hypothetical protein